MDEGTPNLNKALAALQADLPKISKDDTGKVPGKDGKQGYTWRYADLASVSAEILPRLGRLGLAFTSKPTIVDGQFGLVYALVHESGERDEGFYPLPSSGTPQAIGSAITYARRYSLCAVTGAAPAQDDDDAQAANGTTVTMSRQRSAGDAFDQAAPARPRPAGNGTVSRPAPAAVVPDAGDPDADAQVFADEAAIARTVPVLREVHTRAREAHKLTSVVRNPSTGGLGGLGAFLNHRKKALEDEAAAMSELHRASGRMSMDDLEHHVHKVTGTGIEGATAAQLREAAAALNGAAA